MKPKLINYLTVQELKRVHIKDFCHGSQCSGTVSDERLTKKVFEQINRMNSTNFQKQMIFT